MGPDKSSTLLSAHEFYLWKHIWSYSVHLILFMKQGCSTSCSHKPVSGDCASSTAHDSTAWPGSNLASGLSPVSDLTMAAMGLNDNKRAGTLFILFKKKLPLLHILLSWYHKIATEVSTRVTMKFTHTQLLTLAWKGSSIYWNLERSWTRHKFMTSLYSDP